MGDSQAQRDASRLKMLWDDSRFWIGVAAALLVLYYVSGSTKSSLQLRLSSGQLTALVSAFVTFAYLQPLFDSIGMELADVGLYLMTILSALVGMCLGVVLPVPLPGACFGASVALLVGSFWPVLSGVYFALVGPVGAVVGGVIAMGMSRVLLLALTAALVGGGVTMSLVFTDFLPYLLDVARGHGYEVAEAQLADNVLSSFHFASVWLIASLVVMAAIAYRDPMVRPSALIRSFALIRPSALINFFRPGYRADSEKTPPQESTSSFKPLTSPAPISHAPPPASPDAYNMFDPADLPPRLAEYANMVYSACEDLGNFFGFQDSSVRNQAEHLLILLSNHRRYLNTSSLLANPSRPPPPTPIHALHIKVFSNYVKWCMYMGTPLNCGGTHSPTPTLVFDLVLYFCIWGEAANLRHMPECVCFLYHKMMEEYQVSEGYTQSRSLYAGHFLDNVVTPIYEIVVKASKTKEDHQDRRNYDDFNEFFWSRECLDYWYTPVDADAVDIEGARLTNGPPLAREGRVRFISDALESAPKTFLEKRSWLRGILALYRLLEWHLVTFYILSVIAFARELVWGYVYSTQVASGVFWVINLLGLQLGLLEVWSVFPGIALTGTAVCGFVFVLTSRFLILVYQTLYLMRALGPGTGEFLGKTENGNFWWWQYLWISVLVMIPWTFETVLQLYPSVTTRLFTSSNGCIQSFLNIMYPMSRLYVGKEVHESLRFSAAYVFFWCTLIAFKLLFSYVYEVYSMVLPSLELTDDYMNYPENSFVRMCILLIIRWTPQFVVYLIDSSIWYSVWQAFAGTSVGFAEHLGNVRNMKDVRKHFGSAPENFCKKMLSPDAGSRRGSSANFLGGKSSDDVKKAADETKPLLSGHDPRRLQSYVNRLLDVRIQKWVMFSAAWNEIIDHFREEDIISNREKDCLKFSRFDGFGQAIYLPVFQTAGVIEDVLAELERPLDEYRPPRGEKVTDQLLFKPIMEHVTMRTAVSEVWELASFLMTELLGSIHRGDVKSIANLVLKWSEEGDLLSHLKMTDMRSVITNLIAVVNILKKGLGKRTPAAKPRSQAHKAKKLEAPGGGIRRAHSATSLTSMETESTSGAPSSQKASTAQKGVVIDALRDQVREKVRAMAQSVKGLLQGADTNDESREVLDRITFLLSMENGFLWDDDYASDQLDEVSKNPTFKGVLTLVHGLVACHPDDVEPKSHEVRRRLTFFVNSLFMDMPDAPSIRDMHSWNVLTPYYSEDVTYTKDDLERRTDALGVSTLLYLQTLFKSDWNNFLERLGIEEDAETVWSKQYMDETRRWASLRAQTLSRTVQGMMYFEKALRLLANLERLDEDTTEDLMGEKFGYVVSCQVYGNMKKNQDSKADDIEDLMHRFPHLRIAYIDSIRQNRSGSALFYSVLVKSDGNGSIQEIYRVRLPGNPVVGEGKPENQNHAMIFTRGEFVQTIDMNQEGYFEEALKMRNALQEFSRRQGPFPTTILGLREHIFTGSVSSLANYMALQETSFVTLGQRVLNNPLRMRLHYGHPDVFDKLFFITRGGVSKSSKGINLSEDIFAGFNNVIRGGAVGFREYLQVGKGRDVGMSQIYKFEAKLSQGNAEQSLSRDVYRLGHRLDFFRLLSFYYGGIGHYMSNVLTILTVYIVIYLMAVLAIFGLEKIGDRVITPMGAIQMLLGGLGLLHTIPLFATLGVERGWWLSFREIVLVFLTGGPLHFMFHIQTKANYMSQTIIVGGAKYRPTGRGFVTQHTPMDEQYRFFASSHLYLGIELAVGLILMGVYTDAGQYFGRTWSLWLASVSFLASPFWFNPLTFEWSVVASDYDLFLRWMGGTSGGSAKSWSSWWIEENSYYKDLPFPSKFMYLMKAALFLLMAEGIRTSDLFATDETLQENTVPIAQYLAIVALFAVLAWLFTAKKDALPYPIRRTIGILVTVGLAISIVMVFIENTDSLRYALASYYAVGGLCLIGLLFHGVKIVKHIYMVHDFVCGHLIFLPLFTLAALQLPRHIQTWLLYHNALSTDVVISDILRYARKTQEAGGNAEPGVDLVDEVAELKKLVQRQEQLLATVGLIPAPAAGKDAIAALVSPAGRSEQVNIQPSSVVGQAQGGESGPSAPARTLSMSGLDVWGDMALGDVNSAEAGAAQSPYHSSAESSQMHAPVVSSQGFSFSQPVTMPPR